MFTLFYIGIFAILFSILSWRRFEWGLFLFFLLLPTYLIRFHIGPFPSTLLEVMFLLLTAIFIFQSFISHPKKIHIKNVFTKNKLLILSILLFVVGATISIFTSVDIRAALGEWRAFYIEPVVLFFVLTLYLTHLDEQKRQHVIEQYILLPLLLSGFATSLLAIYQHFTGWLVPYSFWANRDTYRVTAWYGFPNAVGLFLAPLTPLAIFFIQKYWQQKKYVIFFSFILITNIIAIVFAKGSGPLLGVAAGIGILLLCTKKTRITALAIGVLALVGFLFLPNTSSIKQELLAKNYSGQLRRDIWSETVQLLKDRPIFGAGIASYEERIVPYRHNHWIEVFHHPHNIFLTIWVNIGAVGLVGFVLLLVWFYLHGSKQAEKNKYILAGMTAILCMGLVDSPYIKNDLAILFWLFPLLLFSQKLYTEKK